MNQRLIETYEELEQVFNHYHKYRIQILLGDFSVKLGKEDIFKPTIGNHSLHEDSNDNGVRVVNFATSEDLVVKSTIFQHANIHKYTWTFPDWKTDNQIDNILIDRRWHSSIFSVRYFRGADCGTDHHMVVEKIRQRLSVISERETQTLDMEGFDLKKLSEVEEGKSIILKSQTCLQLWRS
jgi:hypothetical protein